MDSTTPNTSGSSWIYASLELKPGFHVQWLQHCQGSACFSSSVHPDIGSRSPPVKGSLFTLLAKSTECSLWVHQCARCLGWELLPEEKVRRSCQMRTYKSPSSWRGYHGGGAVMTSETAYNCLKIMPASVMFFSDLWRSVDKLKTWPRAT